MNKNAADTADDSRSTTLRTFRGEGVTTRQVTPGAAGRAQIWERAKGRDGLGSCFRGWVREGEEGDRDWDCGAVGAAAASAVGPSIFHSPRA
jgi:hypothetical protein